MTKRALFLGLILTGLSLGDQIGSFSFSIPTYDEFIVSAYNDQGELVSTMPESYPGYPCGATCLTNTFYVDPTALLNDLNKLPGNYNLVGENFVSPSVISSISDTLLFSVCSLAPCGTAPANTLPLGITATTISGTVGNCGGPPHCATNGYAYAYALDIKFNQPIYALYGNFDASNFIVPTLTPLVGGDLPYSDGYFFPNPVIYPNDGWIFPNGISEIYVGAFGTDNPPIDLFNGTTQFTMSDIDVAIASPEPADFTFLGSGILGLLWMSSRRRRSAANYGLGLGRNRAFNCLPRIFSRIAYAAGWLRVKNTAILSRFLATPLKPRALSRALGAFAVQAATSRVQHEARCLSGCVTCEVSPWKQSAP